MPLYNNILNKGETSKNPSEVSKTNTKNASMKLLQSHLLAKRKQQNTNKQPTKAPSLNLHGSRSLSESEDDDEEYDPAFPNTYEVLQKEYLQASAKRPKMSSDSSGKRHPEGSMMNALRAIEDYHSDDENGVDGRVVTGVAIASPPSLTSSTEYTLSNTDFNRVSRSSSVAAKIMSKMGYKAGQGLGKDEQGISRPPEVEMNGLSGRIVRFDDEKQQCSGQKTLVTAEYSDMLKESTRVLLLQNMVGPGEVDEELEAETKEECKKYGDVVKCLIYEIPNKKVPDEEAVRIFVEFCTIESAVKAKADLNGRRSSCQGDVL